MIRPPRSRRVFGHLLAVHLLARLGDVFGQDALSEYQSLRARMGTNRFLRFEEHATYSTSVSDYRCEWSQTTDGFRFQRRPASEDSGEISQATLYTPDHEDTLLNYRILRRTSTNRYESPAAFYLSDRAITGCTRFATNFDGTPAIAFELTYRTPQPVGPVPVPTRQVVLFDQRGYLRSIHTVDCSTNSASPGVFPVHISTLFNAYSTEVNSREAVRWDQYPVTRTANDTEWNTALRKELEVKLVLRWFLDLPWATRLLLILLPIVILAGALTYLIFGRSRTSPE